MEKTDKKINLICKERIEKCREITEKALAIAKKSIIKGKENEAKEILETVENYLKDSVYFEEKGHYVNSFAAINYAHGWLDSGARLSIFDIKDNKLFTIE